MVGQLAAAQIALEAAISELSRTTGNSADLSASRAQLTSLIDLRQQIGSATGQTLASLRAEVVAAAATATAMAQQAGSSSANTSPVDDAARAQAARQTIESIGRDLFERHTLDPYLAFSSAEDRDEYRQRERDNAAAVQRALALRSVEGNRQAIEIEQRQLDDAKAHGAERSAKFDAMQRQLDQATRDIESPMHQAASQAMPEKSRQVEATAGTDAGLDDVMAALNAAGVKSGEGNAPKGGHGITKTASGPLLQKSPTVSI